MRARGQGPNVSVHAIAGTRVVSLGIDASDEARGGLLGFAIDRGETGSAARRWLRGLRYFERASPPGIEPGHPVSSDTGPIQAFFWGDYTAHPGRRYDYRVYPVYGRPGDLELGEPAEVEVT
ncbi:MAG: hypothetical protein R3266_10685, partial [Gemmatimonadota bacterium]|nr:hypothetical protein [Gemmatimonadota bacterium]